MNWRSFLYLSCSVFLGGFSQFACAADLAAVSWPSAERRVLGNRPDSGVGARMGPLSSGSAMSARATAARSSLAAALSCYTESVMKEVIEALDAGTGKSLWKHAYACAYADPYGKGNGPRATPIIAGDKVYTLGAPECSFVSGWKTARRCGSAICRVIFTCAGASSASVARRSSRGRCSL